MEMKFNQIWYQFGVRIAKAGFSFSLNIPRIKEFAVSFTQGYNDATKEMRKI